MTTTHDCCRCYGEGVQANADEGEAQAFPHKAFDTCYHCYGSRRCECPTQGPASAYPPTPPDPDPLPVPNPLPPSNNDLPW